MTLFHRIKNRFESALLWLIPSWAHPMGFTAARAFLLAPVIFWKDDPKIAFTALVVSSVFDIVDGWLARKRGLVSEWGKLLDPAADKIFTLGTLYFACWDRVDHRIGVAIIVGEVFLVGVRIFQLRFKVNTEASAWGSAKTWTQAIGLGCILSRISWAVQLSFYVLGLAVVIAGLSLFSQVRRFFATTATASD